MSAGGTGRKEGAAAVTEAAGGQGTASNSGSCRCWLSAFSRPRCHSDTNFLNSVCIPNRKASRRGRRAKQQGRRNERGSLRPLVLSPRPLRETAVPLNAQRTQGFGMSRSRLRRPPRYETSAPRDVIPREARAAPSPAPAPSSDRGIFSTGQVIRSPAGIPPVRMCFFSRSVYPQPERAQSLAAQPKNLAVASPSCPGCLLPIAIGWNLPRRASVPAVTILPLQKTAIPSPRRQQLIYQGSLASCGFHPVRLRPSRSHPPCSSNLPQEVLGEARA